MHKILMYNKIMYIYVPLVMETASFFSLNLEKRCFTNQKRYSEQHDLKGNGQKVK